MSLRNQIALLLIVLSLVFASSTWAIQALVMMPAFAEIEAEAAQRNADRVIDAMHGEIENLSRLANDWASWDDTYRFAQDGNSLYQQTNLIPETFTNTSTNLLCILNTQDKIVWGDCRHSSTLAKIDVPDLFQSFESGDSGFTGHTEVNDGSRRGMIHTSQGPMLIASRPLITTKRAGPICGTVIMGRFLTSTYVESLSTQTHVNLNLWDMKSPDIPSDAALMATALQSNDTERTYALRTSDGARSFLIRTSKRDERTLQAFTLVNDYFGNPVLLLRVELPRRITLQGAAAARAATACNLISGFMTLLGMGLILQKRIVSPLQKMATHAVDIGRNDNLNARLNLNREDEIGTLARTIDEMVHNLATTRRKVEENAHRAGMAEIASEVLHNVGNAVNSTSCSTELIGERLRDSRLPGLEKATQLLSEQKSNAADFFQTDSRGQRLIEYLSGLNEHLQQERRDNLEEVTRLHETIRHIRDAIAEQQTMAGGVYCRQEVELEELINDSLRLAHNELQRHGIEVETRLNAKPTLLLSGNRMTQVMVNLIRNAVQALREVPHNSRKLNISSLLNTDGSLQICVQDTGTGITPETAQKLFSHGFTTRSNGHGFGLHFCANTIQSYGGQIQVQSDGPGHGATFRIELPAALVLEGAVA
ncbi:MAG: HAMP domain-containing protein [Planctomyces sp.]|nr:HAMP domain-containing protein [Planctomyces sp.]